VIEEGIYVDEIRGKRRYKEPFLLIAFWCIEAFKES
jgi:hypothetical protein